MQEGGLLGEFSLDVVFLEVERFDGPDELVDIALLLSKRLLVLFL